MIKNKKNNKLPLSLKESLIRKTLELLKQNFTTAMIEKDLSSEFTPEQIREAVGEADAILKTNHFTHSQDILILHTARYRKEITRLLNTPGFPDKKNATEKQIYAAHNRKVKAYFRCIDTLSQLENVIQLTTTEGLSIEINNQIQINLHQPEEKETEFDCELLTFEERDELFDFFMRIDPTSYKYKYDINKITPAKELLEEKKDVLLIEDAVPNVKGMKLITPEPVIYQDESSSLDPVSRLKNRLRQIQARKIQEAGGHLDEQEIEILNRNYSN